MHLLKRAMTARAAQAALVEARRANPDSNTDVMMADGTNAGASGEASAQTNTTPGSSAATQPPPVELPPGFPRGAYEHVEEIMQVLKTAFPLLILSLETMVDQIQHKFKLSPEEEVYRNVCMLMQDATQVGASQCRL